MNESETCKNAVIQYLREHGIRHVDHDVKLELCFQLDFNPVEIQWAFDHGAYAEAWREPNA